MTAFRRIPRERLDVRKDTAKSRRAEVLVDTFRAASARGHASKFAEPDKVVQIAELWGDRHVIRAGLLEPSPAPGTEYAIAFAPVPPGEDKHGRWYVLPELTVGDGLTIRAVLITLDTAAAQALKRGGTAAVIKHAVARLESRGLIQDDTGDERPLIEP